MDKLAEVWKANARIFPTARANDLYYYVISGAAGIGKTVTGEVLLKLMADRFENSLGFGAKYQKVIGRHVMIRPVNMTPQIKQKVIHDS